MIENRCGKCNNEVKTNEKFVIMHTACWLKDKVPRVEWNTKALVVVCLLLGIVIGKVI